MTEERIAEMRAWYSKQQDSIERDVVRALDERQALLEAAKEAQFALNSIPVGTWSGVGRTEAIVALNQAVKNAEEEAPHG